jgi:hypothetical protein
MSSDGTKVKFNLWMFDSGSHYIDENGNDLGIYDCVREDQIEWYKAKSKALETLTGDKVPSLAFQHIVVGEVNEALFNESLVDLGAVTPKANGKIYSPFPKTENIQEGYLFEFPCPSEKNHGQFDAMVEGGDVLAVFSGHDHINTFETELDGIKIINTPGATHGGYSSDFNRGVRMITLNEDDLNTFETELVTTRQLAIDNSDYAEAVGINKFGAAIVIAFGDFLMAMGKFTGIFSSIISFITK